MTMLVTHDPQRSFQALLIVCRGGHSAFAPEALTELPSWATRLPCIAAKYTTMIDANARNRLPRDPAAKIIEIFQTGIALLRKNDIY
jgi:hypothetical protein